MLSCVACKRVQCGAVRAVTAAAAWVIMSVKPSYVVLGLPVTNVRKYLPSPLLLYRHSYARTIGVKGQYFAADGRGRRL